MLTYHLTVKVKKFTRAQRKVSKYGYLDPKSQNRYVIYINNDYPLFEVIGTLYHELSHFVLLTVFRNIFPERREEDFCERMDQHAQKEMKHFTAREDDEEEEEE